MLRRSWRLGALLLAAMTAGSACAADAPATQAGAIAPSPDTLLIALSKPGWQDRRDAIHKLYALGPDAELQVRELLKRDLDKEQRKNVERTLELIRDNQQLGATLISLHLKNATAAEVMRQVVAQAGAEVPCMPAELWTSGSWPSVTIDIDRQPFWDVLKSLSNRIGFGYINEAQELQFSRLNGGSPKVADAVSTDGAFVFGANAYATRRSMIVEIIACGEPKAPVMRTLDLTIQRGVDDQGNELHTQSGRGGFGRRGGGLFQPGRRFMEALHEGPRLVNATFQPPHDGVGRIAELSGQITLSVQSGSTVWEIDDPINAPPITRTIDSIPVTIEGLRSAGDAYELRASIPPSNSAMTAEIIELIRRGFRLLDAAGQPLPMGVPDRQPYSATTDITVDFTRGAGAFRGGPPAKIVWQIPETRKVTTAFIFRDLPVDGGF